MKKRLLCFALIIMLSTSSVMTREIHAEAAATTTAVTVTEAILFLLALAGITVELHNMSAGTYDFNPMLQNMGDNDPELFEWFTRTISMMTAGRLLWNITSRQMTRYKEWATDYFGGTIGDEESAGTHTSTLVEHHAEWVKWNAVYSNPSNGEFYIGGLPTDGYNAFYGIRYRRTYDYVNNEYPMYYRVIFVPTQTDLPSNYWSNAYITSSWDNSFTATTKNTYLATLNGETYPILDITLGLIADTNTGGWDLTLTMPDGYYFAGRYGPATSNLRWPNFTSMTSAIEKLLTDQGITQELIGMVVGGVSAPANSIEETLVGAGSTITDDGNEIVIDDIPINIAGVDIDALTQKLAEGIIDYPAFAEAIGLTAVNTQTMTAEEIAQAIARQERIALGRETITGVYTVTLDQLFPFCIPFDLYALVQLFNADPEAPSAEIVLPVGYNGSEFTWEEYTISLSDFDAVAQVVRIMEYLLFLVGLMLITRKLIEG